MMRKSILQLVSLEPLFLWAGDVNAEETNLVFNMTDDVPPSSTTITEDPEELMDASALEEARLTGIEAPCANEAEISVDSGLELRSHFSH